MSAKHSMLYSEIEAVLQNLKTATVTIDRKELLKPLIDYIQSKVTQQKEIRLNFICTHNSRRSHLAQVWAQVCLLTMAYQMFFVTQEVPKQLLCIHK